MKCVRARRRALTRWQSGDGGAAWTREGARCGRTAPKGTRTMGDNTSSDASYRHIRTAAAERGPLVLFGGTPRPEVVERLRAELGVDVDWPDADRCGPRPIEAMRARVAHGSVAAVVLLEAFMGHRHSKTVRRAAKARGVPVAWARSGGEAAISRALEDIERQLARSSGS